MGSNVFAKPPYYPTREEIELATAAIRAGWSDAERQSRLLGTGYPHALAPRSVEHDALLELQHRLARQRKAMCE